MIWMRKKGKKEVRKLAFADGIIDTWKINRNNQTFKIRLFNKAASEESYTFLYAKKYLGIN